MSTVSVIIPNLNSPIIDQVIWALNHQTVRDSIAEVIVVGQDRYGKVPDVPWLRFIPTPYPMVHGAARNLGASIARGEYLLFLDADCVATNVLVEHLLERHRQGHPVVGGGLILENDHYWLQCDNVLVFGHVLSTWPAGPRSSMPSYVMSIQRDLFFEVGGFNPHMRVAGEDIDLCMRLRAQGSTLFCEPEAAVYHRPSRTSPRSVWHHLHTFGRTYMLLCRRYPELQQRKYDQDRLRPFWQWILLAAPLLALADSIRLYQTIPGSGRFIHLLPGLIWGKTAWYWGAAESIAIGYENVVH